jgi:hypothetical protein
MPAVATQIPSQPAVVTQIPSQPAVVTAIPSQAAIVTSQPLPANIPAVGPGVHTLVLAGTGSMFNQTRTVVVSANNSTTVEILPTPSGSAASGSMITTGSGAMRPSGSQTGTGAAQQSTGAAVANVQLAAGSVFGFGAFVAAFL